MRVISILSLSLNTEMGFFTPVTMGEQEVVIEN